MEIDDGGLAQELWRPVLVVLLRVQGEDVPQRQRGLLPAVLFKVRLPGRKQKRGEARLTIELG